MTRDQEIVKQLIGIGRGWLPDWYCNHHNGMRNCIYDEQGRLIHLHLCGLLLVQVPSEVWQFSSLQSLHLSNNQLGSLPAELSRALPAEVGQLTSLQSLDLTNNRLRVLPAEVGQLSSLKGLYLGGNQLSFLPIEIGKLTSLRDLLLDDNPLQSPPPGVIAQGIPAILAYLRALPQAVERFEAKQPLRQEGKTMAQLSQDQELVEQLKRRFTAFSAHNWRESYNQEGRLLRLSLVDLKLTQLPPELWQFTFLERLDLNSNRLSNLPPELAQLTNLHLLWLGKNQLDNLPIELFQLPNLQNLHLNRNRLSSLPTAVGQLTNLQELYLQYNKLSSLPAELGQLTNLQRLHLASNSLSSLPAELGQLTSLRELNVSNNKLSSLPTELGQLTSLRELYLHRNRLTSLPAELGQLTPLRGLSLYDNPLPSPFPDIFGGGIPAILRYLRTQPQARIPAGTGAQTSVQPQLQILPADALKEQHPSPAQAPRPIKIFYCYAHEDRDLRDRIDAHLGVPKRLGQVTGWYDREIRAGTEWEREIEAHLSTASIILLLVSADFVNSDYCYGVEMRKALEMHEKGETHVIPILLRPVDWQGAPFAKLQLLPTGAKPITRWPDPEEALEDVAREIRTVVNSLYSQKRVSEFQPQHLLTEVDTRLNTDEEHSATRRFTDTLAAKEVSQEKFSQRMGIPQVNTALPGDSMDLNLRTVLWNASYNQLRWGMNSYAAKKFAEQIWQYCFYQLLNDLPSLAIDDLFNFMREHYFTLKWYEIYDFLEFVANHPEYPGDSLKFVEACNAVLKRELAPYRFVGKKLVLVTSDQEP